MDFLDEILRKRFQLAFNVPLDASSEFFPIFTKNCSGK